MSHFFFFLIASTVLLLVAGVFFSFLMHSCWYLNLFCLFSFLAGYFILSRRETDFGSLVLSSSRREESLAVVPWVCTFEAIFLERQWPWRQQISESWTTIVDLKLALVSALMALYIISSKFMDSWSCYSISTLIEGLRSSWK